MLKITYRDFAGSGFPGFGCIDKSQIMQAIKEFSTLQDNFLGSQVDLKFLDFDL